MAGRGGEFERRGGVGDAGASYRFQRPGILVPGPRAGKDIQQWYDDTDPKMRKLDLQIRQVLRVLNRHASLAMFSAEEMLRSIPSFASSNVTWHQSPFRSIRINREISYSIAASATNVTVFSQVIADGFVGIINEIGFAHEMVEGYDEITFSFLDGGNAVEGLSAFANQIGSPANPDDLSHPLILAGPKTVTLIATNTNATFSHDGQFRIKGWIFPPRQTFDNSARGMLAD